MGVTVDDLVRALRFIVATPSYTGDTIAVSPPLIINAEEIGELFDRIRKVLTSVA